jgi:putative SOS response-associated peptidase YedK
MPAILPRESQDLWLTAKTSRNDLLRMLAPFPASEMKMHPVSATVNSPENDRMDLLAKVDPEIGETLSLF